MTAMMYGPARTSLRFRPYYVAVEGIRTWPLIWRPPSAPIHDGALLRAKGSGPPNATCGSIRANWFSSSCSSHRVVHPPLGRNSHRLPARGGTTSKPSATGHRDTIVSAGQPDDNVETTDDADIRSDVRTLTNGLEVAVQSVAVGGEVMAQGPVEVTAARMGEDAFDHGVYDRQ